MASSKTSRTKVSGGRVKRTHITGITSAIKGAWLQVVSTAVPFNPKAGGIIAGNATCNASTLIVLKINSELDKVTSEPLNAKALEAKNMFARYRKNH